MLGFGDKAIDLFNMISPINHSKTRELSEKYKVEPYSISADIYGYGNLSGTGGWTWYTGSASWYYICAIKYILGLRIEKGELYISPNISYKWSEYCVIYKYKDSVFNIKIKNPNGKTSGIEKFIYNGEEIKEQKIKFINNGKVNEIEIIM